MVGRSDVVDVDVGVDDKVLRVRIGYLIVGTLGLGAAAEGGASVSMMFDTI